jgi:hypothetical protein
MDTGARIAITSLVAALASAKLIDQAVVDDMLSRIEMAGNLEDVEVAGLTNKILGSLRQDERRPG